VFLGNAAKARMKFSQCGKFFAIFLHFPKKRIQEIRICKVPEKDVDLMIEEMK